MVKFHFVENPIWQIDAVLEKDENAIIRPNISDLHQIWSAVVKDHRNVHRAVSEIFSVKEWRDIEIWVGGHSRSLKIVPFESLGTVSYLHTIVTMAASCIFSEIKRDIGRISQFFIPPALRGLHRNIAIPFGVGKLEWRGYPTGKVFEDMFSRFDRIPRDRNHN